MLSGRGATSCIPEVQVVKLKSSLSLSKGKGFGIIMTKSAPNASPTGESGAQVSRFEIVHFLITKCWLFTFGTDETTGMNKSKLKVPMTPKKLLIL